MSFRYTNNLIGVLKHRLCLEAAHRDIARRTFTGTCDGIEVTCSGFGSVLGMRLLDPARWEPLYRAPSSSSSSPSSLGGINLVRLARSVRAATWEALQRVAAAKAEAHARALRDNAQLRAEGWLRDWQAQDARTLRPHAWDGLKEELATPWMQAVRYGKPHPARYRGAEAAPPPTGRYGVRVLDEADCRPEAIPVASVHPLRTAALIHLESDLEDENAFRKDRGGSNRNAASRINEQAVLGEQRREMSRDELLFWERVEFIRCGQMASIPGGVKRAYTDQASTVIDDVEDKIELRFTQ